MTMIIPGSRLYRHFVIGGPDGGGANTEVKSGHRNSPDQIFNVQHQLTLFYLS